MAVSIKLRGLEEEFAQIDSSFIELANQALRANVLATIGELKRVTPVDTGRARNSWLITKSPNAFRNSLTQSSAFTDNLLSPPPKNRVEKLYITNGVDYIDKLNAGSSRQAPARFIENAILKRFEIEGVTYSRS